MDRQAKEQINIRRGTIEEVVAMSRQVPEFFQPYTESTYEERLGNVLHLILVAEIDGSVAGFKVGYQKERGETFYSWMGAVLPGFRRMGIAKKLAEEQEMWAREKGFKKVVFKTRNRLTKMIHFGLERDFVIVEVIKTGAPEDYRIVMEKNL